MNRYLPALALLFILPCILLASPEDSLTEQIGKIPDTTFIINTIKVIRSKYKSDKNFNASDSIALFKSIELAKKIGYVRGEAQCYDALGVYYRNHSKFADAIDYHKKALALLNETPYIRDKAIVLNNLGVVYRRIDDLKNAINYHIEGQKLAEQVNDVSTICVSLNSLGNIYLTMGKYPEALAKFEDALKKETASNNLLGMAINYNNIGAVYEGLGDKEKAIEYLNKSLETNMKIGSQKGIAICLNELGKLYMDKKDYDKAQEYIVKALNINESLGDRIYTAWSHVTLGELLLKKQNYNQSLIEYNKGFEIAKEINSKGTIQAALDGLSNVHEQMKLYETALKEYKKSVEYKDSILNENNAKDLNLKQVIYETGKKDKEIELLKYKQSIRDKKQKLIVGSLIAGLVVLIILLALIYGNYKLKQRANEILIKFNHDIEEKNKLLTAQKEEISAQRDQIEEQNHKIHHALEQIQIKNNNITDNIRYAEQIQNALLPNLSYVKNLIPGSFIYYKPKDIVSGDFYWISQRNNTTVLAVADCTGHGVTGAFMSVLGITALNEIVIEKGIIATNQILNHLRDKIVRTLQQGAEFNESNEGIHLTVCSFDFKQKKMQFSGAINSIMILRDKQILQYKGDKMPASIFPNMADFSMVEISLQPDDMIYLYTDGYYGQFGGAEDTKFSTFRFRNLFQKISPLPLPEQKIIVEKTFETWKGESEQVDDILVMGVRI